MTSHPATRGFSLLEILIVVTLIAMVAAVAVPCLIRAQQAARQAGACSVLKLLVSQESIWRERDLDRNGVLDYWVKDVRGLHGVKGQGGQKVELVSEPVALADLLPAFNYGAMLSSRVPLSGYYLQAMAVDQSGVSYVDDTLPSVSAEPATGTCTNRSRFGFTAFPVSYGQDGVLSFVVGEDGVIWQKDNGLAPRVLDRSLVAADAQWGLAGN
jgi:prepilin-type N-terminal cleavage/methylation domain-containing protein